MTLRTSRMHFRRYGTAIVLACTLSACATRPAHTTSLVAGEQATFEGRIVGVDTNPWAYDGNAVVTVATDTGGTVQVQLPARWNLCKAEAPGDVQALRPDDRVQVAGTVTEAGTVVVCEQPQHHLRKVD
jgi:tRNA(Ile2) C34 agmatinyltransferase TiaS